MIVRSLVLTHYQRVTDGHVAYRQVALMAGRDKNLIEILRTVTNIDGSANCLNYEYYW